MIIGGGGSGKSTLAKSLGQATGLPVIHIDPMYWQAGWKQRPSEETVTLALEAIEDDEWIFEGNNSASMQARLERADTIVFLDVGTLKRLWRIILRTIKYYGRTRPDMAEGCPERFSWHFLKFVAGYAHDGRVRAMKFVANALRDKKVYHLRNNRDVRLFLNSVRK